MQPIAGIIFFLSSANLSAQNNIGIGVQQPTKALSVERGMNLDYYNQNNGINLDNGLKFGQSLLRRRSQASVVTGRMQHNHYSVFVGNVTTENGDYYKASIVFENLTATNVTLRAVNLSSAPISFSNAQWRIMIIGTY